MYKLICQKPVHFLSAKMALVSTFFQMFIVLGMYNFGLYLNLPKSILRTVYVYVAYFFIFVCLPYKKKRTSVVLLNEQRAITKWLMRLFLSFLSPCVGPTATVPKLMSELVCFEVASEIWIRYVLQQFHNNSCLTNLLSKAKLIFLEIRFEAIEIACWILEEVCVQDIVNLLSIISEWLQNWNFRW